MFSIVLEKIIRKQLGNISTEIAAKIRAKVFKVLPQSPRKAGKALSGPRSGQYSLKCHKDYRVIYRISDSDKTVTIISVGHRSDIYD